MSHANRLRPIDLLAEIEALDIEGALSQAGSAGHQARRDAEGGGPIAHQQPTEKPRGHLAARARSPSQRQELMLAHFQHLVSAYIDSQALWYLFARALRRSGAGADGLQALSSEAVLATASRLFVSSSRGARRSARAAVRAEATMSDGGERGGGGGHQQSCSGVNPQFCPALEYLEGARDMADAVERYGAWQVRALAAARARGGQPHGLRFLVFSPVAPRLH